MRLALVLRSPSLAEHRQDVTWGNHNPGFRGPAIDLQSRASRHLRRLGGDKANLGGSEKMHLA